MLPIRPTVIARWEYARWLGVTLHRQNFGPPTRPLLFRTMAGARLPNENGPPAASACASSSTSAAIRWSRPATLLAVHKSDPVVQQLQLPDMPAQSAA